jgi:hypothetical protein
MTTLRQEVRRRRLKRLLAQGATPTEIATRLDCSRSTVYRDFEALQEDLDDLKAGNIDAFLRSLLATFETVNEELWRLYHQTDRERIKLKVLREIRATHKAEVDLYQRMGVFDQAAEEFHMSGDDGVAVEFIVKQYDSDHEHV